MLVVYTFHFHQGVFTVALGAMWSADGRLVIGWEGLLNLAVALLVRTPPVACYACFFSEVVLTTEPPITRQCKPL